MCFIVPSSPTSGHRTLKLGGLNQWEHATWFHVGSSLRCVYNPTNPDKVLVFPFAVKGDEVSYNEITNTGPDHVWFYSAT
jgi:hypothetical protein